jgi:hypothetical protein
MPWAQLCPTLQVIPRPYCGVSVWNYHQFTFGNYFSCFQKKSQIEIILVFLIVYFFLQYWGLNSWLVLLGRCCTTWAMLLTIFSFSSFSDRISHFCQESAQDCDPPIYASSYVHPTIPSLLIKIGSHYHFSLAGLKLHPSNLPPEKLVLHMWATKPCKHHTKF